MKITRLETFLVKPRWLFLKVHTDEGLIGFLADGEVVPLSTPFPEKVEINFRLGDGYEYEECVEQRLKELGYSLKTEHFFKFGAKPSTEDPSNQIPSSRAF